MNLSKRAFMRLLALGGSLLPGVFSSTADADGTGFPRGKARLLGGPMLGAVTPGSIRIWLQGSDAYTVSIEVSRSPDFVESRVSAPTRLHREDNFITVITVSSLQPATSYFYRVLFDGREGAYSANPGMQVFTTAPAAMSQFSMAFGSCAKVAVYPRQVIWDVIARLKPDLFCWLGDTVYGDSPHAEVLEQEYQRQRRVESFRTLAGRVPQLAIWDDHDFGINDGDRTFVAKADALAVFTRYWANPAYGLQQSPGVFFAYQYGGVDFFFLDVRFYRDPNSGDDGPQKTMLGDAQKEWLKAQLLRSQAPFKLLISGSAWSVGKGPGDDSWSAFVQERNELFDFIRDHDIHGVVLLSGDTHVAELNAIPWSEQGAYDFYDLTSSPLAQNISASWLERRPERRIRQVYFGGVNFGLLKFDMTVDDPVLEYNVVDKLGHVVWEPLQLRASELRNGVSTWSAKMDALSRLRFASERDGGEYYQPLPAFRH